MSRARQGGRKKNATPPRDQDRSPFTHILEELLAASPGATATALVDFEGETVDYAGRLDPFEVKVAAATWIMSLSELPARGPAGELRQLTLRARRRSYVVRPLQENYAVVVVLHAQAAFAVSTRAIEQAVAALSAEAGWQISRNRDQTQWFHVSVETDQRDRRRPARLKVGAGWEPIEVMGALVGLGPREKGFRVRLTTTGAEMMLVRERLGEWFADEHLG